MRQVVPAPPQGVAGTSPRCCSAVSSPTSDLATVTPTLALESQGRVTLSICVDTEASKWMIAFQECQYLSYHLTLNILYMQMNLRLSGRMRFGVRERPPAFFAR